MTSASASPTTASPRILSIQSHVTSGYVGNRAAVFPLQLLGYDVDVLNSCTLSNHTGYKHGARGHRLSGEELTELLTGLRDNGLLQQVTHVLTGYIGTASCLNAVADAVTRLRAERPELVFACDPVLGDNGRLYVPPDLVPVYVDRVLQLASVLTPNAFELAVLADAPKIESERDALAACDTLHDQHGIPLIFVTGTAFAPSSSEQHTTSGATLRETDNQTSKRLSVLVSSRAPQRTDGGAPRRRRVAVDAARIDTTFTGSGDLLSALLLAWHDRLPNDAVAACQRAVASVTAVLQRTAAAPPSPGLAPRPELKLVQSATEIMDPPLHLVSVRELPEPTCTYAIREKPR